MQSLDERSRLMGILRGILLKWGISKAGLFGSFARGDFTDKSDIDIVIEPPEGFSLLDLSGLAIEIEEATGRQVDILTYKSIHPMLKDKILSEEVKIIG